MSLNQRIKAIENKMGQTLQGYALCVLPHLDTTKNPSVYIDQETVEIIPAREVEKIKEEFKKRNARRAQIYVQIIIDDSPLKDSTE